MPCGCGNFQGSRDRTGCEGGSQLGFLFYTLRLDTLPRLFLDGLSRAFCDFFGYGICCKREWRRGIVEDFLSYNYAGDSNIPTLHRFLVLLLVTCSSFVESSDACFFFSSCKTCSCRAVNIQMHGFSVTRCKGCVGRLNGNTSG